MNEENPVHMMMPPHVREILAAMPDEHRRSFQAQLNSEFDAIDSIPDSERDELRSRREAEKHTKETANAFVEETPLGRSIMVRRYPKVEFALRLAFTFIGSIVGTMLVAPYLLNHPNHAESVLVLLVNLAIASVGFFAAIGSYHLYYQYQAYKVKPQHWNKQR